MSYVRVSIKGTSVGNEVWSVNPVFDPTGEFPGWTQATADAAVAALSAVTVPPNLLVMLSTAFRITSIRMECREDTDDSLIGLAEYLKPTPVVGTGAGKMPPQCAQVVSLRTNTPGGSGRGRIYWPAAGVSVGSSLEASTPSQATTLGDFKTYFQALASSLATSYSPIGFNLAVRSRATHTTPHVTRMQMGNVIDTQRRRRDTLGEVYQTTTVPQELLAIARIRIGRTIPRVLRQTVSDSMAVSEHQPAPDTGPADFSAAQFVQIEFDDGNGVWICNGVSQ